MLNSKVKKIILGGCMLVMAASLVGGCGSSNQPTSNKLVVGTNATFVPFEFKDEKTQDYTGFDIELIRAIGKRINKDVELKNVAFDALIPALNTHDIDVAASDESGGRLRINIYHQRRNLAASIRLLDANIPSFEDLGLPGKLLAELASKRSGLVLVTGPTGSGKSTTLAAMIDYINNNSESNRIF